MSDSVLSAALSELKEKLDPINHEVNELQRQLSEAQDAQSALQAAITALSSGSRRATKRTVRNTGRPCIKKENVIAVCKAILEEEGPMDKDSLAMRAKRKLGTDMGYRLSGFGLRFSECLAASVFSMENDQIFLASHGRDHMSGSATKN